MNNPIPTMIEFAVTGVIFSPVVLFLFSVFTRIKNSDNYSKKLSYAAISAQFFHFICSLWILKEVLIHREIDIHLISWFRHVSVVYSLDIHVDLYAALLLLLTTFISGVIGRFSLNYLAHEEGYYKFFINFYLMQFALYTLVLTSNFYFILISWELLGLASIFLISFYQKNHKTVVNALFVLAIYKFCDLFLILALLLFHHEQHNFIINDSVHNVSTFFLVSLLIASMGKSALFPFSKWVPRAMEGPTTSSAIFYGALSIHAGIILLMKFHEVFHEHPRINIVIGILGLITAFYASLKSRIQTDAKSTLAYATVVQVGLIYVEYSLGLYMLVLLHTTANALLKTYQFIRTPSNIHHYHHLEKLNYRSFHPNGVHFEFLLPKSIRIIAYRMVYHNFGLTLLWQSLLQPIKSLQNRVNTTVENGLQKLSQIGIFHRQWVLIVLGIVMMIVLGVLEQLKWVNPVYVSVILLSGAMGLTLLSLKHTTILQYLIKIKISYFLVSASAVLFFGSFIHDAVFYFVSNLISLLILDYFIKHLSQRLDLHDIRLYLGIGSRYKYINMIAIAILLLLTFTPGFASFVIFDVILEDISEKSQLVMFLFLLTNTLNIYSVYKFIFKIIFGESQWHLNEYPDFTRSELFKLALLILPMIATGMLPFIIFH